MFPISDSLPSGKIPIVNLFLIGINLFVFYNQFTASSQEQFILQYSLIPANINLSDLSSLLPFITSMFLHGGFFHIASNMWFLWVFGDNVEAHIGKFNFLALYIISGIVGNVAQFIVNPASDIPMLGASGAVSGILGSYYILFPRSNIKTLLLFFFFISVTEIPAVIYIFYWFIIQLFSGLASLPFSFATGGIAFWAHVGGFLTGLLLVRNQKDRHKGFIEGEIVG